MYVYLEKEKRSQQITPCSVTSPLDVAWGVN